MTSDKHILLRRLRRFLVSGKAFLRSWAKKSTQKSSTWQKSSSKLMVAGSPGGYLLVLQLQNILQEPVFTTSLNPNSRYLHRNRCHCPPVCSIAKLWKRQTRYSRS